MHENILNSEQKSNLELLGKIPEIKQFYLAGGTALALQIGHRYSVDLDFFVAQKFSTAKLLKKLLSHPNCVKQSISKGTLYVTLNKVSCSFIVYLYPLIDEPISSSWGIQLASIVDIGAMKINAIGGRGYRRDFVDLYFLTQIRPLPKMIKPVDWKKVREFFEKETKNLEL